MTEQEIRQLEERLKPSFYDAKKLKYINVVTGKATVYKQSAIIQRMKDPLWMKAFDEYNSQTGNRLGLACEPCYMKVLLYHKWKLKNSKI